ncbi:MAG: IS66 family transposase [Planctomycetes bacterium]|nr:IS66 family transposase [Planctomycetota bacterium]
MDRVVEVPLPKECHHCQSRLDGAKWPKDEVVHPQYQQDLKFEVVTTQFNVHCGTCPQCGERIQGRHPEQISDALGAAGVQLGPTAHALALELKNRLGLSFGKVRDLYQNVFGLPVSTGALAQARHRHAKKLLPTYVEILKILQASAVVYMDETGWRLDGLPAWLWVATNEAVTLYLIDESRGHEVVEFILAESFEGILVTDCFPAYDPVEADKSKCGGHFLRALKELSETNSPQALPFPREASEIFKDAMALKTHRDEYTPHGYAVACGRIEARMDRLLEREDTSEGNRRLANRFRKHRPHLFTFLYHERVQATNNLSEQQLRFAIQARKLSAGNRSPLGAFAYCVVTSIIQTLRRHSVDFIEVAKEALRSPLPVRIHLAFPSIRSP